MADELRKFEDKACKAIAPADRAQCPLLGNVASAHDYEDGVIVHLTLHTHPHAAIERARCLIAFGHAHGHQHIHHCPLYVEGVTVRQAEQEGSIELGAGDPSQLDELRKRVHDHARW